MAFKCNHCQELLKEIYRLPSVIVLECHRCQIEFELTHKGLNEQPKYMPGGQSP